MLKDFHVWLKNVPPQQFKNQRDGRKHIISHVDDFREPISQKIVKQNNFYQHLNN